MTPEEALSLVNDMLAPLYAESDLPDHYYSARMAALRNAGWRLGKQVFKERQYRGLRGYPLHCPHYQWRILNYWFNTASRSCIWYGIETIESKAEAVKEAAECPLPPNIAGFKEYRPMGTYMFIIRIN